MGRGRDPSGLILMSGLIAAGAAHGHGEQCHQRVHTCQLGHGRLASCVVEVQAGEGGQLLEFRPEGQKPVAVVAHEAVAMAALVQLLRTRQLPQRRGQAAQWPRLLHPARLHAQHAQFGERHERLTIQSRLRRQRQRQLGVPCATTAHIQMREVRVAAQHVHAGCLYS